MDTLLRLMLAEGTTLTLAAVGALCLWAARGRGFDGAAVVSRQVAVKRLALAGGITALALHPGLDALARHALWLHAAQGAVLHHLIPRMYWQWAIPGMATGHVRRASPFAAVAFGATAAAGMLPGLHGELMRDAGAYALMNWSMLLTGLIWCRGSRRIPSGTASDSGVADGLLALLPSVVIGAWLLVSSPIYFTDMALCRSAEDAGIAAWQEAIQSSFSVQADQHLAGLILLLAAAGQLAAHLYSRVSWRHWSIVKGAIP